MYEYQFTSFARHVYLRGGNQFLCLKKEERNLCNVTLFECTIENHVDYNGM
jgi:hypothetical protein